MSAQLAPVALDASVIRNVLALDGRLRALGPDATLAQWLEVPPIVVDIDERFAPHPVEEAFEREAGALRTVCFRPHARLRTVEEVQQASRVRDVVEASFSHLAAHPEDWAARSPTGVRPYRLLARRAEADYDFYENRIVVGTLAMLRRHLQRRLADVRSLTILVQDIADLQTPAAHSLWTVHTRMWGLLRNIGDLRHMQGVARQRVAELEAALRSVELMFASPLGQAVTMWSDLPIVLLPSNLLSGNHQYRRVAELWNACAASAAPMGQDEVEQWRALAAEAFRQYVALLLVQACRLLNCVPEPTQPAPGPGRDARFTLHGEPLTVSWSSTGLLTVTWGADEVLIVRPLLEDFESVRDPALIRERLSQAAEVERGSVGESGGPLRLVIYPGSRAQRSTAADGVVDVLYRIAPYAPAAAPVSPLELASVSRMVRALRWATQARRMADYPVTIAVGEAEWTATRDLGWLAGDKTGRSISALRPPTARELEATHQKLGTLSRTTDRSRSIGDNAEHIRALTTAIGAAAERVGSLTACAVCGKDGRSGDQQFDARDGELFACTCSGCGTRWETRRCRACGERYPVLAPLGHLSRGDREDEVDRLQGGDLLAIACWADSETSQTICPSCGTCGRAGKVVSCPRTGCGGREFA